MRFTGKQTAQYPRAFKKRKVFAVVSFNLEIIDRNDMLYIYIVNN
jgi:hypothetical protein